MSCKTHVVKASATDSRPDILHFIRPHLVETELKVCKHLKDKNA